MQLTTQPRLRSKSSALYIVGCIPSTYSHQEASYCHINLLPIIVLKIPQKVVSTAASCPKILNMMGCSPVAKDIAPTLEINLSLAQIAAARGQPEYLASVHVEGCIITRSRDGTIFWHIMRLRFICNCRLEQGIL